MVIIANGREFIPVFIPPQSRRMPRLDLSRLPVHLLEDAPAMEGIEYQRPAYPSTWTGNEGKGRVFYTTDIWTNPLFQDVLTGGLSWAMGLTKADTPANIKTVAPGAWTNPPYPGDPAPAAK